MHTIYTIDVHRSHAQFDQLNHQEHEWYGTVLYDRLPSSRDTTVTWFHLVVVMGLVSMMLCRMVVQTVKLEGLTELHKTDCSGGTRLVPHVPTSSRAGKANLSMLLSCCGAGAV